MGSIEEKIKNDRKKILPGLLAWARKYWLLLVIVAIPSIMGGTYVGIMMADQPWFCALMCHNMVPHYETFTATRHGQKALGGSMNCMDCHSKQGFFNHLIEHVVASKLVIPNITKPYLYDHLHTHRDVKGFNSEELDFRGKTYAEEKEIIEKCQEKCHTRRVGESYFMQTIGHTRHIVNENCLRCHEQIAELAEPNKKKAKKLLHEEAEPNQWSYPGPRALPNIHPLHLGMDKHNCVVCHSRVVHSTEPAKQHIPAMERCFRCHDNKKASRDNCPACHVNPRNLFAGVQGKGIEETPAYMVETECMECHLEENDYKVVPQVCVDCHDEDYPKYIVEWRKKWEDNYEVATKSYKAVKKKVLKWRRGGRSIASINKIFKKAEYNYLYAARDNSRGIHNPDFTEELLVSANDGFTECLEMMKR